MTRYGIDGRPAKPRAKQRAPEHSFQAWADRFIDRVVLPPMFTAGVDVAAIDMRKLGRIATMQARGIKMGLPDLFVCQAGSPAKIVWIELKRGSPVTLRQLGIHRAMWRAGQRVAVCRTMPDILQALRDAGFALHGNAANLAAEYEARVVASIAEPAPPHKPARAARSRVSRVGQAMAAHGDDPLRAF